MAKDSKKDESSAASRRAYEAPKVAESADFEHLVLTCGHTSTIVLSCNPKKMVGGVVGSTYS
jgi:hypothetical protein